MPSPLPQPSKITHQPSLALEDVDREKALALAAVAAVHWCARGTAPSGTNAKMLSYLMSAVAWVSRARRYRGLPALSVPKFVESLTVPLGDWLPGAPEESLVAAEEPTPFCLEVVDHAGSSQLEEVEQRVIKQALSNLAGRSNSSQLYREFRRFLIENAHADFATAATSILRVQLSLAEIYEPVSTGSLCNIDGTSMFYPCPRCGWPMFASDRLVSCRRSQSCVKAGARYRRHSSLLIALGALPPPCPVNSGSSVALRAGIWRYTTLPGLEELDLAARLGKIKGTEIELWPYLDAYDLDVRRAGSHWRVDVKDHVSTTGLSNHLRGRPATEPTWIVVPDRHRDQVAALQRNAQGLGYSFASSSEFVSMVRRA